MMLLSYATIDFHWFYDGAVDMQIWQEVSVESDWDLHDTQVTIKACWPLVLLLIYMHNECKHIKILVILGADD